MAKPELGIKRICTGCAARFYDLARDPIICPKCETRFDPAAQTRSSRTRTAAVKAPKPVAPVKVVAEVKEADGQDDTPAIEDVESIDEDNEDQAVIEDVSELGEDKDDMFEVMDKVAEPDGDTP